MAKLVRYNSFEALKSDVKSTNTNVKSTNTNSLKSTRRYEEMVNFVDLLRRRFVEKQQLPKKDLKIS